MQKQNIIQKSKKSPFFIKSLTVLFVILTSGIGFFFGSSTFFTTEAQEIQKQISQSNSALGTPSGNNKIVFVNGAGLIYTMNADGTNRRQILNTELIDARDPSFSPDGRKIVYRTSQGIQTANADGSNPTLIFQDPSVYYPSFSPDGGKIVFNRNLSHIATINADGGSYFEVTNPGGFDGKPSWSPTGAKIIFEGINLNSGSSNYVITTINPDGTGRTTLTGGYNAFNPRYSPDGGKIIFDCFNGSYPGINILNLSNITAPPTRVTTNTQDSYGGFSSDGGKIVFQRRSGGVLSIYTINPDGTNETLVGIAGDGKPSWYVPATVVPTVRRVKFDFNGDGKSEQLVFRPSGIYTGYWFTQDPTASQNTFVAQPFGDTNDIPLPGDYDGDGKTDYAVARPTSDGYLIIIMRSSDNVIPPMEYFGGRQFGDVPVIGDFDGDGKTDLSVVRYGTTPGQNLLWIMKLSATGGYRYTQDFGDGFDSGGTIDTPFAEDMDGDGKSDLVVRRRTGEFFVRPSAGGADYGYQYGFGTDFPALADYDGDGKTDIAVYRPSQRILYINHSSAGHSQYLMTDSSSTIEFGLTGVIPVSADYDGDGKADPAVFSKPNGLWLIYGTASGNITRYKNQWGLSTDVVPAGGYAGNVSQ